VNSEFLTWIGIAFTRKVITGADILGRLLMGIAGTGDATFMAVEEPVAVVP